MHYDKCGEVFESVDKYFLHRLGHRKITCQKCQQTFTSIANLTKHQRKKNKFNCHHCNGEFCSMEHLQKHFRSIPKEELPRSKENTLKWIKELDQPIYPSMYEITEEYRELVQEKDRIFKITKRFIHTIKYTTEKSTRGLPIATSETCS